MRKVLLTGALALALAMQGPVAALAQAPHRPSHDSHRFERRPPPSGWSQRQWDYRQDYLRRHGDRRDDHDEAIIAGQGTVALEMMKAAWFAPIPWVAFSQAAWAERS